MKPIEKPTWIENEVSYHLTGLGSGDSVASLLKKLIENQNEIIKDLDLYKRCYESHIRVHEEYREVPKEEPGHWECVDCNHVYSKTDSGAAYMPIENDGEEYNCIFCEPGGGTVHWIPDRPKEDGYYWCDCCNNEVHLGHEAYHQRHVTGPHKDTCPECGEPMECLGKGECPGPFVWQMKCRECGISWVEKPTQAEAIHAWRKVMRK